MILDSGKLSGDIGPRQASLYILGQLQIHRVVHVGLTLAEILLCQYVKSWVINAGHRIQPKVGSSKCSKENKRAGVPRIGTVPVFIYPHKKKLAQRGGSSDEGSSGNDSWVGSYSIVYLCHSLFIRCEVKSHCGFHLSFLMTEYLEVCVTMPGYKFYLLKISLDIFQRPLEGLSSN
ncbi:hypothetical protein STEG23_026063 [Scotinomys teguina]